MPSSNDISLKTSIAGIALDCCVYNASGPRTGTAAALCKIANSASGGVLAKSATCLEQRGNPLPRTWVSPEASLNSEGLPNSGIDYYISSENIMNAMTMNTTSSDTKKQQIAKPYMISISGKTLEDNVEMIKKVLNSTSSLSQIACLELNLACPNVIGKPIIAYDFDQMETVLKTVANIPNIQKLKLGVKLPPYFDDPHFEMAASVLNKYSNVVQYVASINTIGNALVIDVEAEMPFISSNGGFAGLSGPAVKHTALANVYKMRQLLNSSIDVVGVGGIESGQDVFEFLLCGASAVQVGTCHWREGPKCFDRICAELKQLLRTKGYKSSQEVQGKLVPWNKAAAAKSRAIAKKKSIKTTKKIRQPLIDHMDMMHALLMIVVAFLLADKVFYQ